MASLLWEFRSAGCCQVPRALCLWVLHSEHRGGRSVGNELLYSFERQSSGRGPTNINAVTASAGLGTPGPVCCLTRLCLGRFPALDRDAQDGRATDQAPGTTVTETLAFEPVLCRRDPRSHEDLTFLGVPKSVLAKRAAQIQIRGNQALTTPRGSCGAVPITSFSQGSRALIGHPFSNS